MRLIDADALIAEIVKTTTFVKDSVLFQKMVDEAPTVSADRPTGEWIPVGERLPCAYTSVEVTYEYNGKRYTTVGDLEDDEEWHTELLGYGGFFGSKIIAWRPLPEPYKGGDSE